MPLQFRGTAHPPPGVSEDDVANLSGSEIALTNMANTPLLLEHNHGTRVGSCLASWEGRGGQLRVAGTITDENIAKSVRSGQLHGLSLGTDVVQDVNGTALLKQQQELSLCTQPRRPGCYIDVVDGRNVRASRTFSAGGAHTHLPASR